MRPLLEKMLAAIEQIDREPLPQLGSPANPIVVPPALYDALKKDPRFRNVSTIPNLPLHGAVIVRGDD